MYTRSIYTLIVLCLIAMVLTPALSGEDEAQTYNFDLAPGGTIKFDLDSGGSVNIHGSNQSDAQVSYAQHGSGHKHDVEILQ